MDSDLDSGSGDAGLILGGLWLRPGHAWVDSGWMLDGFWIDSEWILDEFWMNSEWILNGFWMDSGSIHTG